MKGNTLLKKLQLLFLVTAFLLMISGCTSGSSNELTPGTHTTTIIGTTQGQDKELTDRLNKEKEILAGQVYLQDDTVIGTMVIKEGVSVSDVDKLTEKYATDLKNKYKNKKVNVQAVQNNKNIKTITLD